jgi:hypothetical protein
VPENRTERQCQRKGSRDGLSRPIEVAGRRGASGTGHLRPQVLALPGSGRSRGQGLNEMRPKHCGCLKQGYV